MEEKTVEKMLAEVLMNVSVSTLAKAVSDTKYDINEVLDAVWEVQSK